MPRGAPAVKIAITVDRDLHAEVVRAARRSKQSVSAWMIGAAHRELAIGDGLAAIGEWEAEHGAFSEDELRGARQRVRVV